LGEWLLDHVVHTDHLLAAAGPITLTHGDASSRNARTSSDGTIALIDWEDVCAAPGITDLAWLLVSSVDVERWGEVLAAYGGVGDLARVLPAAAVQGLLSLADTTDEATAADWIGRLGETARRLHDSR
jgi:aminoglycoside phosphotransferase (APT) family kinase protein